MAVDPLIELNVVVYASLLLGAFLTLRVRTPKNLDTETAFRLLERGMRRTFPDLTDGFTWREGIAKARALGLKLGWEGIERSLEGHEAHRYGGEPEPQSPDPELVRLVVALGGYR